MTCGSFFTVHTRRRTNTDQHCLKRNSIQWSKKLKNMHASYDIPAACNQMLRQLSCDITSIVQSGKCHMAYRPIRSHNSTDISWQHRSIKCSDRCPDIISHWNTQTTVICQTVPMWLCSIMQSDGQTTVMRYISPDSTHMTLQHHAVRWPDNCHEIH